jgi:uncharacterized membrane protein YkvA (DUF1232 family)
MHSIKIEISESVKNHFSQLTASTGYTLNRHAINQSLLKIEVISQDCQDDSLLSHLRDLKSMIEMMNEPHWQVSSDKAQRINAALGYFLNEEDMIPDSTPGLGYLDDCIVINNTKDYLRHELNDFIDFQDTQRIYGKNKCLNRDDWKKIKHQESASRLRHRRTKFARKNRHW